MVASLLNQQNNGSLIKTSWKILAAKKNWTSLQMRSSENMGVR